jgi:hypothetical protein
MVQEIKIQGMKGPLQVRNTAPPNLPHEVCLVKTKQGELCVIDTTGAQFGFYEPLCPWSVVQQRFATVLNTRNLGETRHACPSRPGLYMGGRSVSAEMVEKEWFLDEFEEWHRNWTEEEIEQFRTMTRCSEEEFTTSKREFLLLVEENVKACLAYNNTPLVISRRNQVVDSRRYSLRQSSENALRFPAMYDALGYDDLTEKVKCM